MGTEPTTRFRELADFLQHVGKDPSRLVFEDELTGIHNRRFLLSYLEQKVDWNSKVDFPISLLITDLDEFKLVNDHHGHEAGDQVLTWLATMLKETAGDSGYAVRYGGDEFMLLLPGIDRSEAQQVAYGLLQQTRDRPFKLREEGTELAITISIGVAAALRDATSSTGLFQAADTALYHAKRSGRNQVATAWEIDIEDVFEKTALHKLEATGLSGRKEEFAVVSDALGDLGLGKSSFLVVEGTPGMGKTSFLDAIHDHLSSDGKFSVVHIAGVQQEAYRPYYLAAQILMVLLRSMDDDGAALLEGLSETDRGLLAHVLPQLAEEGDAEDGDEAGAESPESAEEETLRREGIFTTLVQFILKAADSRPVVFLLDDLQFADEASLLLLRILVQQDGLPVFVCGASLESLGVTGSEEAPPLERFLTDYQRDLRAQRIKLRPLSRRDITNHLQGVFPGLKVTEGFEQDLAEITQGNPLFIGEIIRKLITEQMITFTGQQWRLLPLDQGYLPRSLEEIVLQKINDLDAEGRHILEQATALGEDVSLSILTGSSEVEETRVLEFLDRAEALGLVRLGFQVNDEIMRFLGKRVLEISYGTIDEERRQELHERVGTYQESLYQQRLLPSASLLAYHFKRSANQEKARRYEQMQIAYQQTVFNAAEAIAYTGEPLEQEPETGDPLDGEAMRLLPDVFRTWLTAVRSIQLYPPESDAIVKARREAREAIAAILDLTGRLNFSLRQRSLVVNGEEIDTAEIKTLVSSFVDLMVRSDLRTLAFIEGLEDGELQRLLDCLSGLKPEQIEPGFWKRFVSEQALAKIEVRQVRYAAVRDGARDAAGRVAGPRLKEEALAADDLAEIPNIMRALLGAAKSVRLYPIGSKPVTTAVDDAHSSLQGVLSRRRSLSLAGIDEFLLANGRKVKTVDYETLAASFVELLQSIGLVSLTFRSGLEKSDLETFLAALRELPGTGTGPEYWVDFADRNRLENLLFNELQYEVRMGRIMAGASIETEDDEDTGKLFVGSDEEGVLMPGDGVGGLPEGMVFPAGEPGQAGDEGGIYSGTSVRSGEADVDQLEEGLPEVPTDAISRFGKDLLVQGDNKVFRQLLRRLFEDYQEQEPATRRDLLRSCSALLDDLILALQHKFSDLAADILLRSLSEEETPDVLTEMAFLLNRMAEVSVQFSDYQVASRIYSALGARRAELEHTEVPGLGQAARALDQELPQSVKELLIEDLRSGETSRQQKGSQVLGNLGAQSIPLLIEVIKQEKDLRVRQLAANLLAEMGAPAVKEIKRALALEVTVEQRFHILEVIDAVTDDLRDELTYCLGDVNPKIRRAAFRLAERLNDDDLIEILIPFVRDEDPNVAKGTIRSLANLHSPLAVQAVVSILDTTKEPELAVACCQALGQIGDPSAVGPLEKVLAQKSFLIVGRRWDSQVRATAVLALRQIEHPLATGVLTQLVNDRDPIIRQLAKSGSSTAK
jgi:diguanylate cyclase (GGDEF)-like protein